VGPETIIIPVLKWSSVAGGLEQDAASLGCGGEGAQNTSDGRIHRLINRCYALTG